MPDTPSAPVRLATEIDMVYSTFAASALRLTHVTMKRKEWPMSETRPRAADLGLQIGLLRRGGPSSSRGRLLLGHGLVIRVSHMSLAGVAQRASRCSR